MKKIFLITVTALALGACSIFEDAPDSSQVPVQISATIGESALSRASDTSWAEGDEIGITLAMGEEAKQVNIKYTTDGTGEFTGTPIYFYKPMTLTAYYPFAGREGTAPVLGPEGTTPGILETDTESQTPDNQPSIDFLWATTSDFSVVDDKPVVSFEFTHKMSKLTFIFKAGDGADVSKINSYKIDGLKMKGTFNTAKGVCEAKGDASTLEIGVTDVKNEVAVPPLIVFPQELKTALTLTITDSENQSYQCSLPIPIPEGADFKRLEGGTNYQFTIKVSKTGLTVNESKIADWTTISTKDGEEPEASSVVLNERE